MRDLLIIIACTTKVDAWKFAIKFFSPHPFDNLENFLKRSVSHTCKLFFANKIGTDRFNPAEIRTKRIPSSIRVANLNAGESLR